MCVQHLKKNAHGMVTGAIPERKLKDFLRREERRKLAELRGDAHAEGAEGAAPRRRGRRLFRWYTRARMWVYAKEMDTAERRAARGGPVASWPERSCPMRAPS